MYDEISVDQPKYFIDSFTIKKWAFNNKNWIQCKKLNPSFNLIIKIESFLKFNNKYLIIS